MPYAAYDADETAAAHAARRELRALLHDSGGTASQRWHDWSDQLLDSHSLSPYLLSEIWREVLAFDPVLAGFIAEPIPLPMPAVIVAGSGKETFKTFNVSTAASILAAAAGAHVVKGVSRSVSAVSGSADVLEVLGLSTTTPEAVGQRLERDHIAFVPYADFCPTYAGRYDGVFPRLNPFSFFMPAAVLAVRASSFVYGIAHTDVSLTAQAIRAARPDLAHGVVVATQLGLNEMMDEQAGYGLSYAATVDHGHITVFRGVHPPPPDRWRTAIAHQPSHAANAALVRDCLAPDGDGGRAQLVERNAALILAASRWDELDEAAALVQVRNVRLAGGALRLLQHLQTDERTRPCRVS